MEYNFKEIEAKWQRKWEEDPYFRVEKNSSKKKYYCLDMFPYPSASGLHVGHWKGYVFSDLYARRKLLQGYNVLHPMGWDAFGLPAENDAIKKKVHPEANTNKNIAIFKEQLKKIGAIYDWDCEVNTTDPEYYKWTQWIFLQMFKHGYAYQENVDVNWCPSCLTGLANEEATSGTCDRCGTAVELRPLRQWVLKITEFADELTDDIDGLDWPEKVKLMQKNWIGRSRGAEIDFQVDGSGEKLTVFTTRTDTLAGCSFVVVATDHDVADKLITSEHAQAVAAYREKSKHMTDMDRQLDKEKDGVFTGSYAINPLNMQKFPVFLANYVLKHYGTGMVMAVPAHDERDFEFAKKFNLPISQVIKPNFSEESYFDEGGNQIRAITEDGVIVNSGQFDGLQAPGEAAEKIVDYLEKQGKARIVYRYKLRDWVFSRQRYWGEPIPLIHCDACGVVPVPESDLPLTLPKVESYEPTGTGESPLAAIYDWVNTSCPKCNSPAKRETNTMPQWAGSCWYFLRYPSVDSSDALAKPEDLDYWMPVDLYVGGVEHAVLHLLYARFYVKFLHKIGAVKFSEPFKKLFNQGMVCMKSETSGRVEKMSKSKGNVVNPDDIVESLGSDCLRMYMLFMGPPELDTEWQSESIRGVYNFLNRLWVFFGDSSNIVESADLDSQKRFHLFLKTFVERIDEYKVNTAVSAIMEYYNDLGRSNLKMDKEILRSFLAAISIMVPHFASELVEKLLGEKLADLPWPDVDEKLAAVDWVQLPVQVNGKLRALITVSKEMDDKDLLVSLAAKAAKKWLDGKEVKRVVAVKGKIVCFTV